MRIEKDYSFDDDKYLSANVYVEETSFNKCKKLILLLAVITLPLSALASKARMKALGQDSNSGSFYISDIYAYTCIYYDFYIFAIAIII